MDSNSFTVIELMEAYAAQAIVCARGAGLNADVINPGGGSLARGHPIGASGTILAVRLFHELRQRRGLGLAAIAAAGGLGSALIVESVSP
jgi:acetyl-CoA C-acetyltransferase